MYTHATATTTTTPSLLPTFNLLPTATNLPLAKQATHTSWRCRLPHVNPPKQVHHGPVTGDVSIIFSISVFRRQHLHGPTHFVVSSQVEDQDGSRFFFFSSLKQLRTGFSIRCRGSFAPAFEPENRYQTHPTQVTILSSDGGSVSRPEQPTGQLGLCVCDRCRVTAKKGGSGVEELSVQRGVVCLAGDGYAPRKRECFLGKPRRVESPASYAQRGCRSLSTIRRQSTSTFVFSFFLSLWSSQCFSARLGHERFHIVA